MSGIGYDRCLVASTSALGISAGIGIGSLINNYEKGIDIKPRLQPATSGTGIGCGPLAKQLLKNLKTFRETFFGYYKKNWELVRRN